jgi:hypothetical protein
MGFAASAVLSALERPTSALARVTAPVLPATEVTGPTSTMNSPPSLFLRKSLPSVVLTAISPSTRSAAVGTLPASEERLRRMVLAMKPPDYGSVGAAVEERRRHQEARVSLALRPDVGENEN